MSGGMILTRKLVEACVCRLRDKVDPGAALRLIRTVRGVGYVIETRP
ncbi:helix-turn-helix domain-containing protein [Desulfolithobacter sp.]